MANVVEVKQLLNGERNIVLAVYLKSDGASGDLNKFPLFTLAQAGMTKGERLRIKYIAYNFAGFDAVLEFDAGQVNPNWKWVLSEGTNAPIDFGPFGHIIDDSGMDGTGTLQINTTGFSSAEDQGSILMMLRKP